MTPPDDAAGCNGAGSHAPIPKDKKEEMVAAMHELSGALLNLRERLQALSDEAPGKTIADTETAPEKVGASRYQAVGQPFGPGAAARGLWRLFKQKTTRN